MAEILSHPDLVVLVLLNIVLVAMALFYTVLAIAACWQSWRGKL